MPRMRRRTSVRRGRPGGDQDQGIARQLGRGRNVIVLDAGDQFQGSLFYTTYKGAAEAEFMEKIGFDAMAVGNHEFDDGPEGLAASSTR